jgi:hypothetical protein
MSKEGIKLAAEVFSCMQETRGKLFQLATQNKRGGTRRKIDKQDIALAQMLETGKDAMKWKFAEITLEDDS